MGKKKIKSNSSQSSLFGNFSTIVSRSSSSPVVPSRDKEMRLTFPKVVLFSMYCPDCQSKVRLCPDGRGRCLKCTARLKI